MEMVEVTIWFAAFLHTFTGTHTASAIYFYSYDVHVAFRVVYRFHPIMDVQTRLTVWIVEPLAGKAMLQA